MSDDKTDFTATENRAVTKPKRGRKETIARWQVVVNNSEPGMGADSVVIRAEKYKTPEAALRAIVEEKITFAIGLFRPLSVEAKVTARLV